MGNKAISSFNSVEVEVEDELGKSSVVTSCYRNLKIKNVDLFY